MVEINKLEEELQEEWLSVLKERDDKISTLKGANKIMAEVATNIKRDAAEELDDAVEEIGQFKIHLEEKEKSKVVLSEKFAALWADFFFYRHIIPH